MSTLFGKKKCYSKLTNERLMEELYDALENEKNDKFSLLIEEALKALHISVVKIGKMKTPTEETDRFILCLDLLLDSIIKIDARNINNPELPRLIDAQDKDGNTALHLASKAGAEKVVNKLLKAGADLHLRDSEGLTVLHKVAGVALSDLRSADETAKYVKCLQLLLNWKGNPDATNCKQAVAPIDVNAKDEYGFTPLHYAIYMGMEEAEIILLRHGAQLDKRACEMIHPATLESLLDNCLHVPNASPAKLPKVAESKSGNDQEVAKSVHVEIPTPSNQPGLPDEEIKENDNIIYSECGTLWYLSRSPKHQHLLKHPLVKSFVMLKWHNISTFYWTNVLIYAFYLLFCSTYILLLHSGWDPAVSIAKDHLWYGLLVLDIIFFIWEFLQFCTVPCLYIRSFENLVDLAMLSFTLAVLLLSGDPESVRHFSAITILLAWTEGMILLSRHPKLSIYVTMFTKVSTTFIRLLLWYSVLLIGFALSFYLAFGTLGTTEKALNGPTNSNDAGGGRFDSLHESFLKFATMMTGEFDFENLPFGANPFTSRLLFIVFVFLVIFVLINLLNGLAIMDIQVVHSEAETANFKSQVESIAILESILLGDPFHIIQGWTPVRHLVSTYFWPITVSSLNSRNRLIQYIFRSSFLFYKCLPKKSSTIIHDGKLKDSDVNSGQPNKVCSCHEGFQLDQDILEIAKKKALHNQDIAKLANIKNYTDRHPADTEKLTEEVRQFLELRKEDSSKDDPINPKMDKLLSKIDELEKRFSELVQRLPREVSTPLSNDQVQEEETGEEK